jgi:bifunctional non-homologous end joining protein LigD
MLHSRPRPSGCIEPCQPSNALKPPIGAGWIHEIKHDRYRMMAQRSGDRVRLITRNGYDWSERYPAVVKAIEQLEVKSCLIDGELVVCDERGLAVFNLLRHGRRVKPEAHLIAFDLVELDGRDLTAKPLELRKAELARLIQTAVKRAKAKIKQRGAKFVHPLAGLQLCAHTDQPGDVVFAAACKLGCEGIVSKRRGSR